MTPARRSTLGLTAAMGWLTLLTMPGVARGRCCQRTQMNMAKVPDYGKAAQSPTMPKKSLPDNFDWSNVDGVNYLVPSWNQHIPQYCGSCYAHGTLATVQDRIKISKRGRAPDVMLSRQSFLNCAPSYGFGSGCGGGNPPDIFNFMHVVGLPDETCNNYVAKTTDECDEAAMCMNCMVEEDGTHECWPVERQTRYYVTEWGTLTGGEEAMMSEIFSRGPVVCGFVSDETFDFGYEGGVHTAEAEGNETDINHDVELTGWGVTPDGLKFWQARNSWGTYWGEGGFFKIQRGVNLNFIESECYFVITDSSNEALIANGQLTGSMHGLREKEAMAASQGVAFLESLDALDWTVLGVPGILARNGTAAADDDCDGHFSAPERLSAREREGAEVGGGVRAAAGAGRSSSSTVFLAGMAVGGIVGAFMSLLVMMRTKRFGLGSRSGYDGIPEGVLGGSAAADGR